MKNLNSCLLLSFLLFLGCTQMEPEFLSQSGEVRFKAVTLSSFSGNMPNGRAEADSDWKHIFKDQARLEVTDKNTGQTYEVDYNPNEFGDGFTLSLPYGSYTYTSEVEGGKFRRYLPFLIEGEFILNAESLDLTLNATTDYGLITVKNEYISSVEISHGSDSYGMGLLEDDSHYFIYVRNGLDPVLEINEIFDDGQITRKVGVQAYNHYHFFLRLAPANGSANFIELALGEFEAVEEGIEIGEVEKGSFVDTRDGQTYQTVRIGEQTWMAENLNYETAGSWCYDNDPENCDKYGRLYIWNSASTACPEGWHLPSEEEWEILDEFLGWEVAGGRMKSTTGWDPPNTGATNQSGFSALPGGLYDPYNKSFLFRGMEGYWWGSDDWYSGRSLYERSKYLNFGTAGGAAYSCRCIKG
ncbi:MAG: fibrobacter succinogenes major paralogous domain-containing protein [Anditalea sp.]